MINCLVWENGIKTMAITEVYDKIEKMRTDGRNDHGTGSIDKEMVIYLEAIMDVIAMVKWREGGEFGYGYGGVVERGNVGVGVEGDGLDLMLLRTIPGGEMQGHLSGIV